MSARSIREIALGVIGLAAAAVIIAFAASHLRLVPPLERSAIGMDGLAALLDAQGQPARTFAGGSSLDADAIGLRVLPIFERDIDGFTFTPPARGEDAYLNAPRRPITQSTVTRKIEALPTLIILAKWSDGVRRSGLAHPDFLLNHPGREGALADAVLEIDGQADAGARLDQPVDEDREADAGRADPMVEDVDGVARPPIALPTLLPVAPDTLTLHTQSADPFGTVTLRAPQYMRLPDVCDARIGEADRALLAVCHLGETRYWLLSDPDILNNHGLHLGDNAGTALALISELNAGGEVLIDYATRIWAGEEDRRSWWEFLRVLQPPFLWFWIAAIVLFALAFWRSLVRTAPVRSIFEDGHRGARRTIVAAQARLMRNTGRDGALLRALSRQRALALCDLLLGRDGGLQSRKARMLDFVRRRDGALGARLAAAFEAADAAEDRLTPDQAVTLLARLETAYEEARMLP